MARLTSLPQLSLRLAKKDQQSLYDLCAALYIKTPSECVAYLMDRYRADALHIIPALSSETLKMEENERIDRQARIAARKEVLNVLYEERFITDPTQR